MKSKLSLCLIAAAVPAFSASLERAPMRTTPAPALVAAGVPTLGAVSSGRMNLGFAAAKPPSTSLVQPAAQGTTAATASASAPTGAAAVETSAMRLASMAEQASTEGGSGEGGQRMGDDAAFDGSAPRPKSGVPAQSSAEDSSARPPALRPASEWWTIGGRRYESTQEALAQVDAKGGESLPAVYHFRLALRSAQTEGLLNVVAGAAPATVAAGLGGALLLGLISFMGVAAEILSAGMIRPQSSPVGSLAIAVVLAAAAAGGIANLVHSRAAQRDGTTIAGTLRAEDTLFGRSLTFQPDGRGRAVDLKTHSEAATAPEPSAASKPLWQDALSGIGLMALAAVSVFTPFALGLIAAAAVAGKIGGRAAYGTGVQLADAGNGALLVLVLAGSYWLGTASTAAALIGLAVIAAAWGMTVLPLYRAGQAREATAKGQWWSE